MSTPSNFQMLMDQILRELIILLVAKTRSWPWWVSIDPGKIKAIVNTRVPKKTLNCVVFSDLPAIIAGSSRNLHISPRLSTLKLPPRTLSTEPLGYRRASTLLRINLQNLRYWLFWTLTLLFASKNASVKVMSTVIAQSKEGGKLHPI